MHFVVLDGNDEGGAQAGYRRYIARDQTEWFSKDLAKTKLPTIVFIHQSLERAKSGVENQGAIRAIMEEANRTAGFRKVVACFSGHHHRDYLRRLNGILYPQINSASYHWLGGDYIHQSYGKEIHERYPYIKYTAPYKNSLFCMVTIDRQFGFLQIDGRQSEFVGPSPWKLGASRKELNERTLVPRISDWKIPL